MTKKIGEVLIERGLLRRDHLEAALKEQSVTKEKIGRILVRNGSIRQIDLVEVLRDRGPGALQSEQAFVREIPFRVLDTTKTMVIADMPEVIYVSTMQCRRAAEIALKPYIGGRRIEFVAASPQRIDTYLLQARTMGRESSNILERILREALDTGASDIHVQPRERSYTVLFRRDGVRMIEHEGDLEEHLMFISQVKGRCKMDTAERRISQDGAFSIEHNGRSVDMRVSTLPTTSGESMVIRVLDPDRVNPVLENLGITRLGEFRRGVSRPDGLFLICGPTGSGKTTTLNAAVREMDVLGKAVFSIEDPSEYKIPYVGQVETNDTVGLDFARAVKAFMRNDPDIIILGEIRDNETAQNAIKAAETGHLVIGTLHTSSIHGVLGRLKNIGVPDHELRYLLRGVLVQRLVRKVCKECEGVGCKSCGQTGYSGRTIVSECVYLHDETQVQAVINGERWWDTLLDDALKKSAAGITDAREIERVFGAAAFDSKKEAA